MSGVHFSKNFTSITTSSQTSQQQKPHRALHGMYTSFLNGECRTAIGPQHGDGMICLCALRVHEVVIPMLRDPNSDVPMR